MVTRYEECDCADTGEPVGVIPCPDGRFVEYNDYAALEARISELEKDAARYRWLRTYAEVEIPQPWLAHNSLYRDDTDDTWDLVIDTAMQGREA